MFNGAEVVGVKLALGDNDNEGIPDGILEGTGKVGTKLALGDKDDWHKTCARRQR